MVQNRRKNQFRAIIISQVGDSKPIFQNMLQKIVQFSRAGESLIFLIKVNPQKIALFLPLRNLHYLRARALFNITARFFGA